jgi:hypothetical protein
MAFAVRMAGTPGAVELLVPFGAAAGLSAVGPLLAGAERTRRFAPALAVLASAAIVFGAAPAFDHLRSTDRLGLAARNRRLAGEPLGGLAIREAALTYYAGAMPTELWRSADDLARAATSSPTHSVLVWLDSADTVSLARDRRLRVEILVEGPNLADPRVRDLLALCRVRSRDAVKPPANPAADRSRDPRADSDRGRLDPHQTQVEVELGAVVDLVLLEVIQDPVKRVAPLRALP